MALEILKKDNEEIVDYLIRLYENRAAYGLSNQEVADLLNREEGVSYDESRWRKIFQAWENYFKDYVERNGFTDKYKYDEHVIDKYEQMRIELQKEKVRFQDQKREYNKMIRESARFEHLANQLVEGMREIETPKNLDVNTKENNNKEIIVLLNDIHLGMKIDNRFNKYNIDIARDRLEQVRKRVYQTVEKEGLTEMTIVNLGDSIHGTIHASTKLQSEEDTVQQIIKVSEMLINFVKTFLDKGINVNYKNVVGNHGRLSKKGEEVSSEENFEKLILTILDKAFSQYDNYQSEGCRDGFIEDEVAGKRIIYTHGNYDGHNNSAYRLPQLLGYLPDLICSGHVHHMLQKDFGTTLIEVSPSLSGLDEYATAGRFAGKAGQKMILFEDGEISYTSTIYVK